MPLYEYECDACHSRFEKIQKYSDPLIDVCVKCGKGPVRKLLSSPAIQFKGTGWYVTDYAKKSGTDASSKTTATSADSSSSSSGNSGSSDTSSSSKPSDSSSKKD